MALPVVFPFPLPSGIDPARNGNLDVQSLVPVGDKGWLHKQAALAFNALVFAARLEARLPLSYTYGGLYRTYTQQVTTFRQRYTEVSRAVYLLTSSGKRRTWEGRYYRLNSGMAPSATPGTSNHGLAIAWDMARGDKPSAVTSITDADHAWLVTNVHRFGWSYESQVERWHVRYVRGDDFTPDIFRYVGAVLSPRLAIGSTGPDVVRAQTRLGIVADGNFGAQTEATVKAWQGYLQQPQTGVIDADLWWFLG